MQTLYTSCPYCQGQGTVKTHESISIEIERDLNKIINCMQQYALKLRVHPEVDHYLSSIDKDYLLRAAEKLNAKLEFEPDDTLHLNDYHFYSTLSNDLIEV